MSKLCVLAIAVGVAALPARVDAQFFDDRFDTYVAGSFIGGQGGWELWNNDPGVNTTVVNTQSFSAPNSLLISGVADIVHRFVGVTSGLWYARTHVYIPSTHTGESWFILLNTYAPNGAQNWSAQVVFCRVGCTTPGALPGMVVSNGGSEVGGGGSIPLILDQWVEIRAVINLTTNRYQLFYNGVQFEDQDWVITAPLRVEAMDLYSNGASQSFMDNAWLDPTLPVEVMSFTVE